MINLEQIKEIAEKGCSDIRCSECTIHPICNGEIQEMAKAVLFGYEAGLKRGYDRGYKVGSL
jgi:hypothetical protein